MSRRTSPGKTKKQQRSDGRLDPAEPFSPRLRATLGLDDPDTLSQDELDHLEHMAMEQEFARWQKHQERSGRNPEVAKLRSKMLAREDAFPESEHDVAHATDGASNASNDPYGLRPSGSRKSQESPFPTPDELNLNIPKIEESQELTTQQANYIRAYIRAGGITDTALVSTGIDRVALKMWQQQPAFQAALAEAQEKWFEELRKAALLRAQAKSDVLLIFMLKALCPEVYDDNVRKARWMAQNGLVDSENLPVRATLVRDSRTLATHELQATEGSPAAHITQNNQYNVENVNVLVNAANSRTVDPQRELDNSAQWQEAFAVDQSPLEAAEFWDDAAQRPPKESSGDE